MRNLLPIVLIIGLVAMLLVGWTIAWWLDRRKREDEELEFAQKVDSAILRPCPACGARAGEQCTAPTANGRRRVPWFHLARETDEESSESSPTSDQAG